MAAATFSPGDRPARAATVAGPSGRGRTDDFEAPLPPVWHQLNTLRQLLRGYRNDTSWGIIAWLQPVEKVYPSEGIDGVGHYIL